MSKYIKLEDAISNINLEVTGRKEYTGDMKANLFFALDDLPTIEVSEDAISREDAVNALIAHFIPQTYTGEQVEQASKLARKIMANAPSVIPQVPSEDAISKAYLEQEIENQVMTVEKDKEYWQGWNNALDKVVELIEDAPSVIPAQPNIEYILSQLADLLDEYAELDEYGLHDPKWCGVNEAYLIIKNASPKPKEGEWIPCIKDGLALTELMRREGKKWYGYRCTNCNFIYKGNALTESRYCQGCGAKMKGAEQWTISENG